MDVRTRARLQGLSFGLALAIGAVAGAGIWYLTGGDVTGISWLLVAAVLPSLAIGAYLFLTPGVVLRAQEQRPRRKREASLGLLILSVTIFAVAGAVLILLLFGSLLG